MSIPSEASRRLYSKLSSLLDKEVSVKLTNGRLYKGKLGGLDFSNLNMILEKAVDSDGRTWPLVFISGTSISEVILEEGSVFDAKEFAEFLAVQGGIGRHLIKIYEDVNIVEIGKMIRVSANGIEGSGPMAQKIHTLYLEYLRSKGVRV
ncbi:MAG: Lsm family RNA-binding protein [Acidilobaceae archaeon]